MSKQDILITFPFFDELDRAELESILSHIGEVTFRKGTVIFLEGECGEEMYIVKSGTVKIYRTDGIRESILALLRRGHYFGEMALLQRGEVRSANAETLETTELYVLKRYDFDRILEASPRIAMKLLYDTMDRLRKANEQIEYLTFLDVRSRVYRILLRLNEEYGIAARDGRLIDMKLTHQQLADMIGTVRESVTKVLLELQDEDILSYEKRKIVLRNTEALRSKLQPR